MYSQREDTLLSEIVLTLLSIDLVIEFTLSFATACVCHTQFRKAINSRAAMAAPTTTTMRPIKAGPESLLVDAVAPLEDTGGVEMGCFDRTNNDGRTVGTRLKLIGANETGRNVG